MNNRVILVDEAIFTDCIEQTYTKLNHSLDVLELLTNGVNTQDYITAIENLRTINKILQSLSQKNFNEALAYSAFLPNSIED